VVLVQNWADFGYQNLENQTHESAKYNFKHATSANKICPGKLVPVGLRGGVYLGYRGQRRLVST
jgi:hypothetical protein